MSIGSQVALAIERKQAETEIIQKNEQLLILNNEKDKFFSIIAHDLRGPLSTFVAATQILADSDMTLDEIREITLGMKSSATNLYSLLENLLEWSQLRRGVIDFQPQKFNLWKKVSDSIKVLNDTAERKNINIEILIPNNIYVYVDNHMFDTIVRNMVSNALKFTPAGGRINVASNILSDNSVEVKISDTGIGMSPELRSKLFELNGNTSRFGTEGEPSTGLGLLLCKEFIQKHGGSISIESEVGAGTTFCFNIPGGKD
jgi:signal transduction histidine kinase